MGASTERARERCALLRLGHDAGEQLVGAALEHIGTAAERSLPAAEALLAPEVLGLLDPGRPVYAHLRRKVPPMVWGISTPYCMGCDTWAALVWMRCSLLA